MRTRRLPFLIFLTAFGSACYGGAWDRTEVPPPATPARGGATWTQYCTYHGATDLAEVNDWLQGLGRQGWQLVSVGGQTGTMYCFTAPLTGAQADSVAHSEVEGAR